MVLVVDDHPATREVVAALLRKRGIDTRIVPSGHAALRFLAIIRPDAVVLDLSMPDMNGLEILRAIRSNPRLSQVPVLIFSAHENQFDAAEQNGAQVRVVKGRTSWMSLISQIETLAMTANAHG